MREVDLLRAALCLLIAGLISLCGTGFAATLQVPQDYPDITAASNVAQPGDSILVWPPPGYHEGRTRRLRSSRV
jgi:hypothetical protein